ncbi:MAG: hypothetical protein H0W89_06175 [Candidatus Levybacteria bacterium]|nr:hypothetical protein [Candidatus Levybacteria bacterium]
MKLKLKIVSVFCLALVVLPGFVWLLLTGKIAQAFTPTSTDSIIYDESLSNGWQNWSWNSTVDFNALETPKSGAKAIAATMNSWGGLYLHTDTAIDSTVSEAIIFSLRPTQDGTNFAVLLYDENNQPIGNSMPITTFGEAPTIHMWKSYSIPHPANRKVKGVAIQDISGKNDNKVLIDDFFVKQKPIVIPTPIAVPAKGGTIYTEGLASGWENWSWSSAINFDNATPALTGQKSLAFAPQSPWAGMYLHTNAAVDANLFASLQFSLYASQANQQFALTVIDEYSQMAASPINLEKYGAPVQGAWKTYTVPLSDLGATNKRLRGIILQEVKGQAQPAIYLDDVAFISNATSSPAIVQPSVLATQAPTAMPTPLPVRKFTTLTPGSQLPSGEECTAMVRRSPWEPRPENTQANNTKGIQLTTRIDGANAEGNQKYLARINGDFTGTTDEIIQWGACKWGLDEEIVRAVAAQESWWRQSTLGDYNGKDYESYGLLQVRRTYHEGTHPTSVTSVPFNVDYALGWRRACMDGYFDWIPAESRGDEWGCVGLWFSGQWKNGDQNVPYSGSNWYTGKVKGYLETKPWLHPDFVGSSQ